MSDQNVVKEGWVQKRGEDSPPLLFFLPTALICCSD